LNPVAITICFVLVAMTQLAFSQRITASLGGTILDPSGAAVPGAVVRIVNADTGAAFEQKSDQEGHFRAPSLTPGVYNVVIEAKGFKQTRRNGITLLVDQDAVVDFTLELGAASETLTVTTEAPLLDSATSDVGQVVVAEGIENMPLVDRNPFSLILLSSGVSGTVGTDFHGLQFNVNGQRSGTTDLLLDGVPAAPPTDSYNAITTFPSVDAIQEFKVQTAGYSAEFGASGAGIINLVYKSGTNQFHGSLYEFLRNNILDANNFFSNLNGRPLVNYRRNQFGGVIGGPVLLPKYNGRNRTFFFFSYEGLRQRTASSATATVPTAEERTGDFSHATNSVGRAVTIYDPLTLRLVGTTYTRTAFPGNVIPVSRFDRVAANIIRYFPLPNASGINGTQLYNYYAAAPAPQVADQFDLKGDENLSDKQRLSLRLSRRVPWSSGAKFFPADIEAADPRYITHENSVVGALNYTYTVSPSFLTEFRWGISHVNRQYASAGDGFDPTQLGFPTYIRDTANLLTFPTIAPSGYVPLGQGSNGSLGPLGLMVQTWALSATKVTTRHMLKMGVEVRQMVNNVDQEGGSTGNYSFPTSFTQGPNAQSGSSTAGDGFASFLLGLGSGTVTHNFKIIDTISKYTGAYIQDDWRVSRRLTLNVGLRYELYFPRTERHNRETYLDLTAPSPLAGPAGLPNLVGGLDFVGVDGHPRSQYDMAWRDFAPRFGFAVRVTKRLVLRGGYGIYYGPSPTEAAATVSQTGFRSDSSYLGTIDGVTPNNYLSDPFPNGSFVPVTGSSLGLLTAVGTAIAAPFRHSPTPYAQNATLGAQLQLPGNWLLEAKTVDNRGVKLLYNVNMSQMPLSYFSLGNQLIQSVRNPFYGLITNPGPYTGSTILRAYLLQRFPQFNGTTALNYPGADSVYYSLQLRAEKRFSHSFWVLVSYTGSRMFDDASTNNASNFNGNGTSQNALDLHSDWSLSTVDVSQRLVTSFFYDLPFGSKQRFGASWNRMVNGLLGGWRVSGIATFQTGNPLAFSANNQNNTIGAPGERPNNNGHSGALSGPVEKRLLEYFDTSVFSQPPIYTLGSVSRTDVHLRAPGGENFDLSLIRQFRALERFTIQFRAEAFNALNWVRFSAPSTSVGSTTFGVISAQANTPRMMQFGLKILF
jgi:hypothetical protein